MPGWMNARNGAGLILCVFALRVVYLFWLCGYELLGDEALYWESGRRLDWGYYEKGPVMPWSIALATAVVGTSEAGVRLAAAVWSAVAGLGVLRLAQHAAAPADEAESATDRSGRAATPFIAATMFLLAPAFQANAQLATPDAALIALWVWGCVAALALIRAMESRSPGVWLAAAWFGFVLGVGTLAKQSMLLLLAGVALNVIRRPASRGALSTAIGAGLLTFGLAVSPLAIWNWQHGWPTVLHTLEHLGLYESSGAAHATEAARPARAIYNPVWTLSLVGAQIGAFGPALCALMWIGVRSADSRGMRSAINLALSALAVYLLVSFTKQAEPNWPFHAFASILAPAAAAVARELPLVRERIARWRANPARPHEGFLRRRPESVAQVAWDWTILYGVGGQLLIAFLPQMLANTPDSGLTQRFRGHRAQAAAVHAIARGLEQQIGIAPPVIASHYMTAGLLAFYLPGRPVVWNAGSRLGTRTSSYDYWPDTRLELVLERHDAAILNGTKAERWAELLKGWRIETVDAQRGIHVARRTAP
ncbi:MAG: glycosyltransferase family 39 protein [Phycisphaerae bacterium]|nr:glycosyltransferase family 39 protein [Phycisphaerae bacterium]